MGEEIEEEAGRPTAVRRCLQLSLSSKQSKRPDDHSLNAPAPGNKLATGATTGVVSGYISNNQLA